MAFERPQLTVLPSFNELLTTIPVPGFEPTPRYNYLSPPHGYGQGYGQGFGNGHYIERPLSAPLSITPPPNSHQFIKRSSYTPPATQYTPTPIMFNKIPVPNIIPQQYSPISFSTHPQPQPQPQPQNDARSQLQLQPQLQPQPLQYQRIQLPTEVNSFETPQSFNKKRNSVSSVSSETSMSSSSTISLNMPSISSTNSSTSSLGSIRASSPELKRKHVCKTCARVFTTSGHLARHNRIHTGERKHLCPWPSCDARFARQDNCMQHHKTHTNGKSKRRKYLAE